ncbi:MAG: hypothetical protein V4490_04390 [Pseudomonadota bacterium]
MFSAYLTNTLIEIIESYPFEKFSVDPTNRLALFAAVQKALGPSDAEQDPEVVDLAETVVKPRSSSALSVSSTSSYRTQQSEAAVSSSPRAFLMRPQASAIRVASSQGVQGAPVDDTTNLEIQLAASITSEKDVSAALGEQEDPELYGDDFEPVLEHPVRTPEASKVAASQLNVVRGHGPASSYIPVAEYRPIVKLGSITLPDMLRASPAEFSKYLGIISGEKLHLRKSLIALRLAFQLEGINVKVQAASGRSAIDIFNEACGEMKACIEEAKTYSGVARKSVARGESSGHRSFEDKLEMLGNVTTSFQKDLAAFKKRPSVDKLGVFNEIAPANFLFEHVAMLFTCRLNCLQQRAAITCDSSVTGAVKGVLRTGVKLMSEGAALLGESAASYMPSLGSMTGASTTSTSDPAAEAWRISIESFDVLAKRFDPAVVNIKLNDPNPEKLVDNTVNPAYEPFWSLIYVFYAGLLLKINKCPCPETAALEQGIRQLCGKYSEKNKGSDIEELFGQLSKSDSLVAQATSYILGGKPAAAAKPS